MKQFKIMLHNEAKQSDFVVFSGSIPRGLTVKTYQELISLVSSYTKTVLDADGDLLVEGMKTGPYMIKPNIHELEAAFDLKLSTDDEIRSFCRMLSVKYNISLILVSMGRKGSLLVSGEDCYKAEPIKVEVKSTVGAGDSMIAGMLYGIDKGLSLKDSFAFATACGTLAVTKEGTMTLSLTEIQEMLKKVCILKLN
jgi:1-phosphofructokinase